MLPPDLDLEVVDQQRVLETGCLVIGVHTPLHLMHNSGAGHPEASSSPGSGGKENESSSRVPQPPSPDCERVEENASLSEDEGDEETCWDLPEGYMGDQMEDRPEEEILQVSHPPSTSKTFAPAEYWR
ncbi:phosphatase and actin regulator 3a, partial [Lates japonicus]